MTSHERLQRLLPWLNGVAFPIADIREELTIFLALPAPGRGELLHPGEPMISPLVETGLSSLSEADAEQLRHELQHVLAMVVPGSRPRQEAMLNLKSLLFIVRASPAPSKRPRTARERRMAASQFPYLMVGGDLRDVVLYQAMRLLTAPGTTLPTRCPAPAEGSQEGRCDHWVIASGPRRGRRATYCSDACRIRTYRREEAARRKKPITRKPTTGRRRR